MQQYIQFVQNHWQLFIALIVVAGLLIFEEIRGKAHGGKRLSSLEVVALMNHENAVIVDLRSKQLFEKGHVLGAINASPDNFNEAIKKIEDAKNKPVVLVDANGTTVMAAVAKLQKQGFMQLYSLVGGMDAWRSANMPLSTIAAKD